jgi:hypothetical protein
MALTMLSPSYMPRSGLRENGAIRGACFGSVPVRDAPEGVFDRRLIDCVGIVFIRPFFGFSMALVGGVCNRFKPFEEARNSTAILGRSVSFAANEAWIGGLRLTSTDIGDREPMLPLVAD